ALDHVNARLASELGQPLRVGMGIHCGPLLLGRIGYGEAVDLTVIGNAVNLASRLQELAKEKGFQIVLSRGVAVAGGWLDCEPQAMGAGVRGVAEPIEVVGVARGRDLPVTILAAAEGEEEKARTPTGEAQQV